MCKRIKRSKKASGSSGAENIELRERINALRGEISSLREELESYKAREREITEALNFARIRSEEYLKESKIRFTLESERLKAFSARWQARLKTLGDAEKLGEEVLEAGRFFADAAREIEEVARGGVPSASAPEEEYYREKIRLDELGALAEERSQDSVQGGAESAPTVFPIKNPDAASKDRQPRLSEDELLGLMAQLSRTENMG